MWRVVKLLNVESVLLELYNCPLIVVYVAVVRRREDRDDSGEFLQAVPLVHLVAIELGLMRSKD